MREYCAVCGARVDPRPVDGSDPDDPTPAFWEVYECANGHTGRYEWDPTTGTRMTGALRDRQEVSV